MCHATSQPSVSCMCEFQHAYAFPGAFLPGRNALLPAAFADCSRMHHPDNTTCYIGQPVGADLINPSPQNSTTLTKIHASCRIPTITDGIVPATSRMHESTVALSQQVPNVLPDTPCFLCTAVPILHYQCRQKHHTTCPLPKALAQNSNGRTTAHDTMERDPSVPGRP